MAKRERVVKCDDRNISSTIIRADSCKLTMEHQYDTVITSPPWPGYDNASNGVTKLTNRQWQKLCTAIANFCVGAQSKTGIKGLIELPGDLADVDRQVFISCIQEAGLQILRKGNNNLFAYVTGHKGEHLRREWWVVLDKTLTPDQCKFLADKIPQIEKEFDPPTRPAYNDRSMTYWKEGAFKAARESRIAIPPRLASKHLSCIFDHLLDEGDTVFDLFAGTGETLKIAMDFKVNSIGVDISRSHVAGIEHRMRFVSKKASLSRGASKTGFAVDVSKTTRLHSQKEQDQHGLIDRLTFLAEYGIDPNFDKRVQAQFVSHQYTKYTGKKPAYLYRRPNQGELSESRS